MELSEESRREILEHEYQRHIDSHYNVKYQARQRIGPQSLSSAIESITRTRDALSEFSETFRGINRYMLYMLGGIRMELRQIKSGVRPRIPRQVPIGGPEDLERPTC